MTVSIAMPLLPPLKETFEMYPDITYKSKIKSMQIFDNWASVQLTDTSVSNKQALTQAIVNNKPVLDKKLKALWKAFAIMLSTLKNSGQMGNIR